MARASFSDGGREFDHKRGRVIQINAADEPGVPQSIKGGFSPSSFSLCLFRIVILTAFRYSAIREFRPLAAKRRK